MEINKRITQIRSEIPSSVSLIVVSKQQSVESIKEAYNSGIRDFAENRLQEALEKQEELKEYDDISWHFIGHLQTNKAKKVLENFNWIHSVDSLRLAQHLNQIIEKISASPYICLKVKAMPDPDKYGWLPETLWEDLHELEKCKNLMIRGLMTILPLNLSTNESLHAFQKVQTLAQDINEKSSLFLKELSMGMSNDYLLAIQKNTTMIRLGRTIFEPKR